jgi:hypothetical protein
LGTKEAVEKCRLARGLRSKYSNKVVVEACWDNILDVEVFGDVRAVAREVVSYAHPNNSLPKIYALEDLVFVNDLDAMLVCLLAGLLANTREMRVHHHARRSGVSNIAWSGPVGLERVRSHG